MCSKIEVRDSRTGYLVPVRYGLGSGRIGELSARRRRRRRRHLEILKNRFFDKKIQNVQMSISTISTHPKFKFSKKIKI